MLEHKANRVRHVRQTRALSQVALAARSGLSRQSIGAIEAGRSIPAVDVALRIADTLGVSVEELFGAASTEAALETEDADVARAAWTGAVSPGLSPGLSRTESSAAPRRRVALACIAGRWLSYSVERDSLRVSADALAESLPTPRPSRASRRHPGSAALVRVQPLRPLADVRENLVLMGCALGLGVLADRLNAVPRQAARGASHGGSGRFLWFPRSSSAALGALARQQTHVAGVHLVDAKTGTENVVDVRRLAGQRPLALITLGRWEVGLLTPRGNPQRIRSGADLARRGLRLAVREPGSGARRLLEAVLKQAGLPSTLASAAPCVAGHLEVALSVALGAADTGIATRDAALAFGLGFVPLAEERYDLAVALDALTDPRLEQLFDVLGAAAFRSELAALGYDASAAGTRVAQLAPDEARC